MKFLLFFVMLITMKILAQDNPPTTVDHVDLNKYIGLWFEIAKIPNSFQNQCVKGTTAKYSLNEDGEIVVLNSCIDKAGKIDEASGIARVVDKKSNSKLEVSFFSIFGWRPIWGDYWIIGLDENYQWAIVGTPNRKYGWILSRTTSLNQDTLQNIYAILRDHGYNPKDFEMSKQ
jgi:apolipoprotein D and lipocalin family protein